MYILNLQDAVILLGIDKVSKDIKYMSILTYNLWYDKYYKYNLDKFPNWTYLYNLFMSIANNKNTSIAFTSLGQLRYLSALQHVDLVIGNSSSGLIEVPSFKIPTINIGDRQRGRVYGLSVINCKPTKKEIIESINLGLSESFRKKLKKSINPYGNKNSSIEIVKILKKIAVNENLIKKKFYNL